MACLFLTILPVIIQASIGKAREDIIPTFPETSNFVSAGPTTSPILPKCKTIEILSGPRRYQEVQICNRIPNPLPKVTSLQSEPVISDITILEPRPVIHIGSLLNSEQASLHSNDVTQQTAVVRPVYEDVVRTVPVLTKCLKHHLVDITHHVPIIEKVITAEYERIVKHVPVIHKVTKNVVETQTRHIPVTRHRTRIVEEPYTEHIELTEKITKPVVESVLKKIPVVVSRFKPLVFERIRHIPVIEKRIRPIIEESVTTVPVTQEIVGPTDTSCTNFKNNIPNPSTTSSDLKQIHQLQGAIKEAETTFRSTPFPSSEFYQNRAIKDLDASICRFPNLSSYYQSSVASSGQIKQDNDPGKASFPKLLPMKRLWL